MGQTEETPTNERLCPECGTAIAPSRPPTSWLRVRRWGPAGVLIVLALFLVAPMWMHTAETSRPSTIDSAVRFQFVGEGWTIDRIREAERGMGDGSLARGAHAITWSRLPERPGTTRGVAMFQPATGMRTDWHAIGWPVPWWSRSSHDWYADVFERAGVVARPVPGDTWWERIHWHSGVLSVLANPGAASAEWIRVSAVNLAVSAACLIGAWYGGRAACTLHRRVRGKGPSFGGRWGAIALLAAAAGLALASGLSARSIVGYEPIPPSMMAGAATRGPRVTIDQAYGGVGMDREIELTDTEIRALPPTAEGDARIARAILDAIGDDGSPLPAGGATLVLAMGLSSDTVATSRTTSLGWPWRLLEIDVGTRDWRTARNGSQEALFGARPTRVLGTFWYPTLVLGAGQPTRPVTSITVQLPEAVATLVAAWLVYQAARGAVVLLGLRRSIRRRLRGECLACGYDLSGIATSDPSPSPS